MRLTPEAWPGALQTVARLLGDDAAAVVARGLGGGRSYLPAEPGPSHPLARLVGVRAARLVAAQLVGGRGDHIDWPAARTLLRYMEAADLKARGHSEAAIARRLRIGQRQVRRLVGHLPKGAAAAAVAETTMRACPLCGHRHRQRHRTVESRQLRLSLD